jgi:hypothetical protein
LQEKGALFGPRSDTVLRLMLAVLVGGGLLVLIGPLIIWRSPLFTGQGETLDQPLQFDHRHHVGDDGIDCRFCHREVERSSTAGYPSTATCMGCHAQIWIESPILEALRRSQITGQPIHWRRVYTLPEHVYFCAGPTGWSPAPTAARAIDDPQRRR